MKLALHFARLVWIYIFFFDYTLLVGSARKAVVPSICRSTFFRQYGTDWVYDLVLSTGWYQNSRKGWSYGMRCIMSLNWRVIEVISCKTVSTHRVEFGPPYQKFLDPSLHSQNNAPSVDLLSNFFTDENNFFTRKDERKIFLFVQKKNVNEYGSTVTYFIFMKNVKVSVIYACSSLCEDQRVVRLKYNLLSYAQ